MSKCTSFQAQLWRKNVCKECFKKLEEHSTSPLTITSANDTNIAKTTLKTKINTIEQEEIKTKVKKVEIPEKGFSKEIKLKKEPTDPVPYKSPIFSKYRSSYLPSSSKEKSPSQTPSSFNSIKRRPFRFLSTHENWDDFQFNSPKKVKEKVTPIIRADPEIRWELNELINSINGKTPAIDSINLKVHEIVLDSKKMNS